MKILDKAFEKVDLDALRYSRAPGNKDSFFLGLNNSRDLIRFWEGKADFDIKVNSKYRQLAISVGEKARKQQELVKFDVYSQSADEITSHRIKREAMVNRKFYLPDASFSMTDIKLIWEGQSHYYGSGYRRNYSVKLIQKTKDTEQHFLAGLDETKYFICALPTKPKSVVDAHNILKPEGISNKAVRQGEWFFDPATKKELKSINNKIARTGSDFRHNVHAGNNERLFSSSHFSRDLIKIEDETFVCGIIHDSHLNGLAHKPLILNGWHRLVRNNEVQITQNMTYWD